MCRHNPYHSDVIRHIIFPGTPDIPSRKDMILHGNNPTGTYPHSGRRADMSSVKARLRWKPGGSLRGVSMSGMIPAFLGNMENITGFGFIDWITFVAICICVIWIVRILNTEHRKSKEQFLKSQRTLEEERNELERRMSERTMELITAKRLRREELERIAQFGRISQGLFHDLMNPLSAASLSVEQLAHRELSPLETEQIIGKAIAASRRMRDYMESIKTVIAHREHETTAEVSSALAVILDLLSYKARMAGVTIETHEHPVISLPLHPLRLQQLFLNIISNAIEACEHHDSSDKKVSISIQHKDDSLHMRVSDTGPGISQKHIHKLLKEPFTTKKNGTGVGLMTVKSIVEEDLGGEITIQNTKRGVVCEVRVGVKK
jgi:signal transduction histidine kinase